jgi:hypothetical protein
MQGGKLERIISSVPVGIDIFGMFLITRRLFISLISFIFSFQIVLLQMQPVAEKKEGNLDKLANY